MVIEGFFEAARIKKSNLTIPIGSTGRGEPRADVSVDRFEIFVGTYPEKLEEIVEMTAANERDFELEHRVLPQVHIDRVNFGWAVQQIVEGVAAGTRDHDNPAVGANFQQCSIDARILPAGIIDQLTTVDMVEHQVVRRFEEAASGGSAVARIDRHEG